MLKMIKCLFDLLLDLIFSEARQYRLGMHIINRVRGDDNFDPQTNGEYWILKTIKKQFQNKDIVIFDVGASVGDWAKEAISGLSSGSSVYSFEPTAATFSQLEKSVDAAFPGTKIFHPINAALSDQNGTGTLHVSQDMYWTNSLHKGRLPQKPGGSLTQTEKPQTTELIKGDDFCRQNKIEHIHFLKIDAEAHEVSVLEGFKEMLSQKKIDYIQFEYFHGWIDAGHFLYEAVVPLIEKGYTIAKLRGNGLLYLDGYDKSYEKFEFCNYLAISKKGGI